MYTYKPDAKTLKILEILLWLIAGLALFASCGVGNEAIRIASTGEGSQHVSVLWVALMIATVITGGLGVALRIASRRRKHAESLSMCDNGRYNCTISRHRSAKLLRAKATEVGNSLLAVSKQWEFFRSEAAKLDAQSPKLMADTVILRQSVTRHDWLNQTWLRIQWHGRMQAESNAVAVAIIQAFVDALVSHGWEYISRQERVRTSQSLDMTQRLSRRGCGGNWHVRIKANNTHSIFVWIYSPEMRE